MTQKERFAIMYEAVTTPIWAFMGGTYLMVGTKPGYLAAAVMVIIVSVKVVHLYRLVGKK